MKFFGHPTAKPTKVLGNTPQIGFLHHRPMKKHELKSAVKTTVKGVRKSDGKATYQGSAALKGTQTPDCNLSMCRLLFVCVTLTESDCLPWLTQGLSCKMCFEVP